MPAALIVLLLLALPGAVLLAVNLLGRGSAVNGWLQEHVGISYHLATPWLDRIATARAFRRR